ncbi:MAG: hypothetical protein V1874_17765 [Spirochaetota bacterium]
MDNQTLFDLEIITLQTKQQKDENRCIFDIFNKTQTRGGRYALERYFKPRRISIKKIEAMQNVFCFILNDYDNWNLFYNAIGNNLVKNAENYINENISCISPSKHRFAFLKAYWWRFQDKNTYSIIAGGLKCVLNLLQNINRFHKIVDQDNCPQLIKKIFRDIKLFSKNDQLIKTNTSGESSPIQVFRLDTLLRGQLKHIIQSIIKSIYEMDAILSLATAIKEYSLVFPKFIESPFPIFNVRGLYHPFINDPVRNSISIEKNNNFVFLTGPNLAGKSTFIKACGIAVYLAHIGLGVPAEEMELSCFDGLITSINTEDNIRAGYSYFYSEVKRMKEIAEQCKSGKNIFVIIDELFKGTNHRDAYDASLTVISSMMGYKDHIFLLSTHLSELLKDIKKYRNIIFNYFDAELENGKPFYKYALKKGVSFQRLGMIIFKNENIF